MAQKTVYLRSNGEETTAYESPLEPGVWHIPPKATEEEPPSFDVSKKTCKYIDDEWVIADIPEPEAEPKPEYPLAIEQLRFDRNVKLAETDYFALSDHTLSDAMKTYRQDLRNLPSTASPKLDENGNLTNVTWPTKPS